jgi:hypothetical protein
MSLNLHTCPSLLVLATIIAASSLALASNPAAATGDSPGRLPRVLDRPSWALPLPAGRLDRNLKETHYSEKTGHVQTYFDDGPETVDGSYVLPGTDQVRIAPRALTEGELDILPGHVAGSSMPSIMNGLRTSSEWFPPSAPTESAPPAFVSVEGDIGADESALGTDLEHCKWLGRKHMAFVGALVFTLTAAGTMLVVRLLWRWRLRLRRRAKKESLGLGYVKRELDTHPGSGIEKAGLL